VIEIATGYSHQPIPFNRPFTAPGQLANVGRVFASGQMSGDGPYTRAAGARLSSELLGAPVLLTPSCTDALELSALLLDLAPGDEVITTPFTFMATVNAFVLRGARPVFVDIRPDTLNIDEQRLAAAITPRTRAIVVVHYAGVACEMDVIERVALDHGIPLVEDNAHGLFGRYRGRPLGTFGALATLSFDAMKNVTSGQGGALVLNDRTLLHRAEQLRAAGTNRADMLRAGGDDYTWVGVGSNYVMSEIAAAVLAAQLDAASTIQRRRACIWHAYHTRLAAWCAAFGVQRPTVPDGAEHPAHLYHLLMPSARARSAFCEHMRRNEISAVRHYVALNRSLAGRDLGAGACPVAEDAAERLVRLPLFADLDTEMQRRIVETITAFDVEPWR
jgi:dTDP-4-amino-4,6-dideoxygalactose transaminase